MSTPSASNPHESRRHPKPQSFPGLSVNTIRANTSTVRRVKNVNRPLSEMWSLSMESCNAFTEFSIQTLCKLDSENSPEPVVSTRVSVTEHTLGILRYLSQSGVRMLSRSLIARTVLFLCESHAIQMFILLYVSCFTRASQFSRP